MNHQTDPTTGRISSSETDGKMSATRSTQEILDELSGSDWDGVPGTNDAVSSTPFGVALAAVQRLAERVDEKEERINDLEVESKFLQEDLILTNAELELRDDRLDDLRVRIETLREENNALRERLAALEERLDALEDGQSSSAPAYD